MPLLENTLLPMMVSPITDPNSHIDEDQMRAHSDELYALIVRHRVWYQVRNGLQRLDPQHPLMRSLNRHCAQDTIQILKTAAETALLARLFKAEGLVHCFLKGIALNVLLYEALCARPCRDIDVWVHPNDYAQARQLLLKSGYASMDNHGSLSGFQARYWLQHDHHMTFAHPNRGILIELHTKITHIGISMPVNPDDLTTVTLFNTPVYTLKPDEFVLHLMIHGAQHGWVRLRWLNDVRLFFMSGKCNAERVLALASQQQCDDLVAQTCLLLQTFFQYTPPLWSMLPKPPTRRALRLTQMATRLLIRGEEKGVRKLVMLLRFRWYLIQLATPAETAVCAVHQIFEIHELFPLMTLPERLYGLYYVCYPFWLIRQLWRVLRGNGREDQARSKKSKSINIIN